MKSLDEARAYQKQEISALTSDLWEAILEADKALKAGGLQGLPAAVISKANANLVRAGVLSGGSFTDEELSQMATADGVRTWEPDMGTLFPNEPVIGPDGETYITLTQHQTQAGWAPGFEGGRTLFRLLRKEPEACGEYLTFQWGERVPFGAVRLDPEDGKLYTPIHECGVTLYEPHFPHLVPSEYALYDDPAGGSDPGPEPSPGGVDDWDGLEANHLFAVGDRFTCDGQLYEVRRVFNKQEGWRPPVLSGDFYQPVAVPAPAAEADATKGGDEE